MKQKFYCWNEKDCLELYPNPSPNNLEGEGVNHCFIKFYNECSLLKKMKCNEQYNDVDDALYEWYLLAKEWLVPVTRPMMQEEALLIAGKE